MGSVVEWVSVVGTLATVVVAAMTWRIANKQTSIAEEAKTLAMVATQAQTTQSEMAVKQTALSESQIELATAQGDISGRLAAIEEARARACLVPSNLNWNNNDDGTRVGRFILNNMGGPAWNIHFTGIRFAYLDSQSGEMVYDFWSLDTQRLEACVKEEPVTLNGVGHLPEYQPGSTFVLAVSGIYEDMSGQHELGYEALPSSLDKLLSVPEVREAQERCRQVIHQRSNEGPMTG